MTEIEYVRMSIKVGYDKINEAYNSIEREIRHIERMRHMILHKTERLRKLENENNSSK